jgi:hypothetical protein
MANALISAIDSALRARQRILEYSDRPNCIFRMHVAAAASDITLSDATRIEAGSRLVNLHLWNERIPPFPDRGPTLSWARGLCHDFEISLGELAAFIACHPALDDVVAIAGNLVLSSPQKAQLLENLAARYGFVRAIDSGSRSASQRLHQLGENILISMIVISFNPAAFRIDFLRRNRLQVYLHRAELMRRFGRRRKIDPSD